MRLWASPQLSISITKLGLQYVVAMFLIGLLAVNTGNNLLFIVFSLMISFFLASGILSRDAIRDIDFKQIHKGHLFARIKGNISIDLKDQAPYRLRGLSLRLETESGPFGQVFLSGGEGLEGSTATFQIKPPARGHWKLKSLECRTSFPFGFMIKSCRLKLDQDLLIFPNPRTTTLIPELSGEKSWRTSRTGASSPEGARPFNKGDQRSHIHWKRTAQRGSPWVRTFEGEASIGLRLQLDLRGWKSDGDFEDELERLSGAILQAKIRRHPVSLEIRSHKGRTDIQGCEAAWSALATAQRDIG